MKHSLGLLFLFSIIVTPAFAYNLFISNPSEPYEVVPIEGDIEYRQIHLGYLEDYPIMYEVSIVESTTLTAILRQPFKGSLPPNKLGLMVVKKNEDGGVTDEFRFIPSVDDWIRVKDESIGLTFWDTEEITHNLEVGEYFIEVSSPNNIGKYILKMGDYSQQISYLEELTIARHVQKFMGYSILRMMVLPTIYYPVGIIFILFFIFKIRKYIKNL